MQYINYFLTKYINANTAPNYVIQSIAELNTSDNRQRAISIALPFLSLHSKTASAASHIARFYQLGSIWFVDAASRPKYDKSIDTLKLAGSVAISIIFPSGQLLYSSLVLFIEQAQKFQKGGNRDKAESLHQIISQIVHLASIYYRTPKWVVLSLLSQGAGELNKAYKEERTPEAIANVLLATIRGYKAGYHIYNDFSLARAKQVQLKPISRESDAKLNSLKSEENAPPAETLPEINSDETDFTEQYAFPDDDYEFPEDELYFVNTEENAPPAEPLPEINSDEPDFSEQYDFPEDDYEFPEDELYFVNTEENTPPAEPLPEEETIATAADIKNLTDNPESEEEPDECDQIEPPYKNPNSSFTDLDHELNGDLEAKMDARRVTMVDTNGNEYDFGSYFHGYGKYLVKGANLHFRKVVLADGSKNIELSFRINNVYRSRLWEIIHGLSGLTPDEKREFAHQFQSSGMASKNTPYTIGQETIADNAYKVAFKGLGSLTLGRCCYNIEDRVIATIKEGATLESFHQLLSIMGLEEALKKSSDEDLERLKIGVLFRTFFPTQAYYIEKNDSFFTLPLDQLKQRLINKIPKMKTILENYTVEKREILPGYVKYGTKVDQKAYSMGVRALTTATSLDPEMKDEDLDLLANMLKNGLFSQELRLKSGMIGSGMDNVEAFSRGGAQSVYVQMITSRNVNKQTKLQSFVYGTPVRFYFSLDILNQGSYQYYGEEEGARSGEHYIERPTIFELIKKDPSWLNGHEIMIPDRILPEYIKALSVGSEEIKQRIIAYLRKCDLIHDEKINGIPVNEFIRTEDHITPDLVKHCAPKKAG